MAIVGNPKLTNFNEDEESESTDSNGIRRRWRRVKTLSAETKSATVHEGQQFSTPSGYHYIGCTGNLRSPANEHGRHEERYEQVTDWTTTTTT